MALEIRETEGSVTFHIRVQPRASRSELAGEYAGALRVRVTAPPLDGRANAECVRLIAGALKVSRSSVEIIAGETSRTKTVRVIGVTPEQIIRLLPD